MFLVTHLMKVYTHEKLLESNNRSLQDAKNYHIYKKKYFL